MKTLKHKIEAEELDKIFDKGQEDILKYFDLSKGRRINDEQRRVNVDFPKWMIQSLDKEASHIGISRQAIIKTWIAERLESLHSTH